MPTSEDSTLQYADWSATPDEVRRSHEWIAAAYRERYHPQSIPLLSDSVRNTIQRSLNLLYALQTHEDAPQSTSYDCSPCPWMIVRDNQIEEIFSTKSEAEAFLLGGVFWLKGCEVIQMDEWRRRQNEQTQSYQDPGEAPDLPDTPPDEETESSEPNTGPSRTVKHVRIDHKDHAKLALLVQQLVDRHPQLEDYDIELLVEILSEAAQNDGKRHAIHLGTEHRHRTA